MVGTQVIISPKRATANKQFLSTAYLRGIHPIPGSNPMQRYPVLPLYTFAAWRLSIGATFALFSSVTHIKCLRTFKTSPDTQTYRFCYVILRKICSSLRTVFKEMNHVRWRSFHTQFAARIINPPHHVDGPWREGHLFERSVMNCNTYKKITTLSTLKMFLSFTVEVQHY